VSDVTSLMEASQMTQQIIHGSHQSVSALLLLATCLFT